MDNILARCTEKVKWLLAIAVDVAEQRGRGEPTEEDLLDALAWLQDCVAVEVLKNHGVFLNQLRPEVHVTTQSCRVKPTSLGAELAALLRAAWNEAQQIGHDYCGTEHLLLALLASPDDRTAALLQDHDVTAESVRSSIIELLGTGESGS